MRSLLGIFTYNWKLKGSAFALALLLWVTVTADQQAVQRMTVPVDVEVRNANFRLVDGPNPAEVQVQISGPRREFWDLGLNRPRVRLLLSDVREGAHQYLLDPGQVEIPQRVGTRGLSANLVTPNRVTLSFERVATATIPVQIRLGSAPRQGYTLANGLAVRPASITVTGPAERIAQITAIPTTAIDLARVDGEFERRVDLDLDGLEGIDVSAQAVVVAGTVERAVQQVVAEVPVRSPPGVLVVPGSVDVQLWGAESALRRLDAGAIRAVVVAESIPPSIAPGGTSVPVRIEPLPAGVRAVAEPRTVRLLAVPEPPPVPDVRTVPGPLLPAPAAPDTANGAPAGDG